MDHKKESFCDEIEIFRPLFCPNPDCTLHDLPETELSEGQLWFVRRGLKNGVWQFICKECSRCFSESTFKLSYYEKVTLDYDEILGFCDENITLEAWASLLKTTAPTLKIRLHKLLWIVVQKLEERIEKNESGEDLKEVVDLLAECQVQYGKRKGHLYPVLRDLIFRFKNLLAGMNKSRGEVRNNNRPFFSNLKQNLLRILRFLIGQWRYLLSGSLSGLYYWSPHHQIE